MTTHAHAHATGRAHGHSHAHAGSTRSGGGGGRGATTMKAIRRVFIITLVLNLVVAIAKASYGLISGSIALGTDSVHAFLDGSSNVLALMSLHWASAPADERHPYGHRKIEILAAVGIGVLIVIGLAELTEAAVRSLVAGRPAPPVGWPGFVVVAGTMVINFFISRFEERRGHDLGSALLCADAQHTRSDLYASTAVLLSFVGARLGFRFADPVGAMFVVVLVGRAAWLVFRDNVPTLIDAAVLDPHSVAGVARQMPGVVEVHRVRSRGLRSAATLDLHVTVDPQMSICDANELAVRVEAELRSAFPELADVTIKVGPAAGQNQAEGQRQDQAEDQGQDQDPKTTSDTTSEAITKIGPTEPPSKP